MQHDYQATSMNVDAFFYRVFKLDAAGNPVVYLGTAFPIAPNGGLITCRHVVDAKLAPGERIGIHDVEREKFVPIVTVRYPEDSHLDVAYLPDALDRTKEQFFPILDPPTILTGDDVYSFGFLLPGGARVSTQHGFFKGNVVNMSRTTHSTMTLSYPIIEGLSGSPVLTYHHGPKVVGLAIGSTSSRVVAAETLEYEDGAVRLRETISRIVEFGVAYHAAVLVGTANELSADIVVAEGPVDIPGLE
jgi:hypothetical protein